MKDEICDLQHIPQHIGNPWFRSVSWQSWFAAQTGRWITITNLWLLHLWSRCFHSSVLYSVLTKTKTKSWVTSLSDSVTFGLSNEFIPLHISSTFDDWTRSLNPVIAVSHLLHLIDLISELIWSKWSERCVRCFVLWWDVLDFCASELKIK